MAKCLVWGTPTAHRGAGVPVDSRLPAFYEKSQRVRIGTADAKAVPVELERDREELAAAHVGRSLCGTWRLDELIGVGGMGAVYAATHRDGTRVAVKLLHGDLTTHPEAASRFLREGLVASRVADHPNALRILDQDVDDDGTMFLVMELLEGGTLHRWAEVAGGTLAPREALLILDQLLDVLVAVHEAGIVHRDIKPENVFLTTDGEVKLLDFGIARMGEAVTVEEDVSGSGRRRGISMGSPVYMSPEQASGRWDLVDAQSDIWSVGATMFTLLSGEPIHVEVASSPDPLTGARLPPRSLASACPRLHPAVVDLVDRALRFEARQRWTDAAGMRAAVHGAYLAVTGELLPGTLSALTDPAAPELLAERDGLAETSSRRDAGGWLAEDVLAASGAILPWTRAPADEVRDGHRAQAGFAQGFAH